MTSTQTNTTQQGLMVCRDKIEWTTVSKHVASCCTLTAAAVRDGLVAAVLVEIAFDLLGASCGLSPSATTWAALITAPAAAAAGLRPARDPLRHPGTL